MVAYDFLFEKSSYREIPTPSINHDCTIKIDVVVKISVNKINGIRDNMEQNKFSIKIFKQDKGVDLSKFEFNKRKDLWSNISQHICSCSIHGEDRDAKESFRSVVEVYVLEPTSIK